MKKNGPDLFVEVSSVEKIASEQLDAVAEITDAKDDIKGLVGGLTKDHGLICTALVNAMKAMEETRNGAADTMAEVSTLLAASVDAAASAYAETDDYASRNVDKQVQL